MFTRLRHLFERTISQRELCATTGGPLHAKDGSILGYLDVVQVIGNRLSLQGWTTARNLTISLGNERATVTPYIQRSDLKDISPKTGAALGFAAELPYFDGPVSIELSIGQTHYNFERGVPTSRSIRRSKFRHLPTFISKLVKAAPHLGIWYLWRTADSRSKIKSIFELTTFSKLRELSFDGTTSRTRSVTDPFTIIIPVYNAFEVLQECLERVRKHTDGPWKLIIVEDKSTDPRVHPFLKAWCSDEQATSPGRVKLVTNKRNLGFVQSVNRALDSAGQGHIILLNSDALVPFGWASRLLEPMLKDPKVASVTPMSNDAELGSVPVICQPLSLKPGEGDALDLYAQTLPFSRAKFDAPTGVGFCMAMNREFLDQIPEFDTRFGRGYGEEVDWCQKARALGGRHVLRTCLFVEHRSGSSFGASAKNALLGRNNAQISRRYQGYDADVQAYVSEDPVVSSRLALGIFLAGQNTENEIPVYLAHSWGGGAELYLKDKIKLAKRRNEAVIILRVGGAWRWQLELHTSKGSTQGGCNDLSIVERLLTPLRNMRVIYSCGVGDAAPNQIPSTLIRLAKGHPIDVLFHDYFPLNPAYHLLDHKDQYVGVAHGTRTVQDKSDAGVSTLSGWRREWGKLFQESDNLVTFSASSASLVRSALPEFASKVTTRPHNLHQPVRRLKPPRGRNDTIGILGNINAHKGAQVTIDLAKICPKGLGRNVVLIGALDPSFSAPKSLQVHGEYDLKNLHTLATRYQISCWVIPSIWPETFSYTTHEALATELPVFVFDIGAQAEAVAKARNGHVVPLGSPKTRAATLMQAIKDVFNSKALRVA